MKSVDVTTAIHIDRPRRVVAQYVADPDHAPEWDANIAHVTWETEKPLTVGTHLAFVAHFLGRTLAYTYEVADSVAGERLVMATSEGPFRMETSYIWTDLSTGGTHLTLRNRGMPSGFAGLAIANGSRPYIQAAPITASAWRAGSAR